MEKQAQFLLINKWIFPTKEILEEALELLGKFMGNNKPNRVEAKNYLRKKPLPFICCYINELSTTEQFHYSFRFLKTIGKYNVALAVGMCTIQYMAFSISALPVKRKHPIGEIKHHFMNFV